MSTSDRNSVTSEVRRVAKIAAEVFDGVASVQRFYDADKSHSIGILTCKEAPQKSFFTYSTVGVNVHEGREPVAVSLADCVAAATALSTGRSLATADPPLANLLRAEGGKIHALPDTTGRLP